MIVAPRGVVNLAAGWMTARAARRLRRRDPGHADQHRAFATLAAGLGLTACGKSAGVEAGMRYEVFQRRIPPRTYADLAPFIERMKHGESDVLWPGRCRYIARSSGTTTGEAKDLPVTDAMLAHFTEAARQVLLAYMVRVGHTRVLAGRHLFLGASATLAPAGQGPPPAAAVGDLGGIAAANLPGWARRHFYEPGDGIAAMDDWSAKLDAIADRTRTRNITLLAGLPNWILLLAERIRAAGPKGRSTAPFLKLLWPGLECLVHGGVPLAPFQGELKAALGAAVNLHEIYPSSEGFIAVQDGEASLGLRLMTGAGVFFEFLPMAAFDEKNVGNLGARVVPLEAVQTGVAYAPLLTTPAGLCRYVLGDVVRFVSTDVPRLIYIGRTDLQLNVFGEHVTEKDVTDALVAVCQRHGWTLSNFHVAPVFADTLTGQRRGGHEWWIELKAPTVETPTANVISPELDAGLLQRNPEYEVRRKARAIDAPAVRLVMPGVFEQWLRKNGRWGGQNKMPRCRSDRQIADQLADLSRFYIEAPPPFIVRRT